MSSEQHEWPGYDDDDDRDPDDPWDAEIGEPDCLLCGGEGGWGGQGMSGGWVTCPDCLEEWEADHAE